MAISDSKSNTWNSSLTEQCADNGGGDHTGCAKIFYSINPTVGTGHTFQASTTGSGAFAIKVLVFSYTGATPAFDQQSGAHSAPTYTTIQPGSITPGQDNELFVAGGTAESGTATLSYDSGFTNLSQQTYTGLVTELGSYLIETTAIAKNPTLTSSEAGVAGSAVMATFK